MKADSVRAPVRQVIPEVLGQHVEQLASLWILRVRANNQPDLTFGDFVQLDERIAAHFGGVRIAGDAGWEFCQAQLATDDPGAMFAAMVIALESKDARRIENLVAMAEAVATVRDGLESALGWAEANHLRNTVLEMLKSASPLRRLMGVAACALQRVDPGLTTSRLLEDPELAIRARALRTAGELGRMDTLSACTAAIAADDPGCHLWGAWSAVLLGDRNRSLEALVHGGAMLQAGDPDVFRLCLLAMDVPRAHELLQHFARSKETLRPLIQGSGFAGDPGYVPWLIGHMSDAATARLAGDAFALITGADVASNDLEAKPPADFQSGPNDNPEDANVEMDQDDGLPWPDQEKIRGWWNQNGARFTTGVRHFMGAPTGRAHCIGVLKNGYQRQRIAAAYHLCLLNPGTPLFEWRAPAWRQQRELARMT